MNLKPVIGLFVACATLGASEISAIWPDGKMPGAATDKKEWATVLEKRIGGKDVLIVGGVSKPTIELFRAEAKAPTGFVIICPGGGYSSLAYDYEGTEIAQWLNARGVSAMVLKYRVPDNPEGALMDAQRAVRLARANAEKWNIAPNKIAVMGFSAGANLCARASTQFDTKTYEPVDAADSLSPRPDFTVLVYPAYCDKPNDDNRWKKTKLPPADADYGTLYAPAENLDIAKNTPPAFIVQTQADGFVNAAISYYLALKKNKIPANLFLFDRGEHGFSLRNKTDFVREWEYLFDKWLKINKFYGEK